MWTSNHKPLTPNLKQLKLVPKVSESQTTQSPTISLSDPPSSTDLSTNSSVTWRKELKLTRSVERERKKLSTATASSCSTSTSFSSFSSRAPSTPSDLPLLDDRLSLLDEKLEAVENMFSARKQMFELLGKDSDLLNIDLQREIQRRSQQPFHLSENLKIIKSSSKQTEPTRLNSDSASTSHDQSQVDQSAQAQQTSESTEMGVTAGWGGYFKKLW